ncbi:MAG: ribosome maturation factor RimM [Aestuariivirga sp.]
MTALVTLGVIGAPHGVKGEVRVKSSTADPLAIGSYGPLTLPDGRRLKVKSVRPGGEVVIVKLEGVNDRTAAEALKFQTLSVPRDRLPPPDDEDDFYHADLIGLRCETAEGLLVGHVAAIHDFGAGDILDIKPQKGPNLTLSFTKANVPVVDVAGGKLVVVLPDVVEVKGGE